ncbi:UNVERIFIED_CONTAM: hypothetical protein GTU68_057701 [Idotea baltica]|nr:hypothetical protein [Idotea baltica]
MYQVDAFSDTIFKGNPAAVIPLQAWLEDDIMQAIAAENNLSETAFFVQNNNTFEEAIANIKPDFNLLSQLDLRGVIISAPSANTEIDFACRFFAPKVAINEDPVTGSAYTKLTPYWAGRLNKTYLRARQISQRGGDLWCSLKGDRVTITGYGCLYMQGQIFI